MEAPLVVRLVQVEPVLLLRPPLAVVAVGAEHPSAVEGGDQVLRAPEVLKHPPHPGQAPQVPHHLRLPDASAPDDAVVTSWPAGATTVGVVPGPDVRTGDAARGVRALEKVPQQAVGLPHLPLICNTCDHNIPLVCEVRSPSRHVIGGKACSLQGLRHRHAGQRPVGIQQAVDVAQSLVQRGVPLGQRGDLLPHLHDAAARALVAVPGQDAALHAHCLVYVEALAFQPQLVIVPKEVGLGVSGAQLR
mmetsp:Transcript_99470/g.306736  ORF Transcript_99470/g.306736 Transcript_99470/m.306736 type:complete len:247 (-) Transcript_99470:1234-1974(-)